MSKSCLGVHGTMQNTVKFSIEEEDLYSEENDNTLILGELASYMYKARFCSSLITQKPFTKCNVFFT